MMPSPATFRPQIRADIVFGPPMISGSTTVYYVKDTLTSWFYRIGAREYFLISRMDGKRTLQEIEAEYIVAFKRRLSPQSWAQIFSLLGKRHLLEGAADAETLKLLKSDAEKQRKIKEKNLLHRRFSLLHPDRFFDKMLLWVRFAFHPVFVYLALVAIVILEIFFMLNLNRALTELRPSQSHYLSIPYLLVLCLIMLFFLAVHEIAHGLACKYFGGEVQEMGLGWRYFVPYAYCKIDDVVLFHNRWHRVYTAFAGIFINLLMVIPFAVLWLLSPVQSMIHLTGAFVLVFVNILILLNFFPFVELDGYLMLSYALNMIDLRHHAVRVWGFRKQDKLTGYEGPRRYIYLAYSLLSLIYLVLFTACVLFLLIFLLKR